MAGTNILAPVSSTLNIREVDASGLALSATCTGTPPTTASVFAHGCQIVQTDSGTGNKALYENVGSSAVPSWNLIGDVTPGEITLAEGQVLVGNSSGVAAASAAGAITVKSLSAGATGVVFTMYHDSASPAVSDVVSSVVGQGEDSGGGTQVYSKIDTIITDPTAASEDGDMVFSVVTAGTVTEKMRLDSDVAGLMVGTGAANAIVTSNGAFDLVLNTNAGTSSGNITIADGAAGAISVTPDGAGTITVGGSTGTGDITIGSSSGAQSVLIGNGAGVSTVSLANVSVAGANVNVATAATGAGVTDTVSISTGNAAATGIKVVNIATGTPGTDGNNRVTLGGGATSRVSINALNTASRVANYIPTETGAANAIAGALVDASGANVALAAGLRVVVKLANTLQAGANTFNLNGGGAVAIKSHNNVANDIGTAYANTGVIELLYDGTQWLDMSQ